MIRRHKRLTDAADWILVAALIFIIVGITLLMQSGCCLARCKTVVEKPVRVEVPCDLPPVTPRPDLEFKGPPSCSESFPVCMTSEVASKLLRHLMEREGWIEEALAACGKPSADLLPTPGPESEPVP